MSEHPPHFITRPILAAVARMLVVCGISIVAGILTMPLQRHLYNNSGCSFLLLPFLLGCIAMFTVSKRALYAWWQRLCASWLIWFGIWLPFLRTPSLLTETSSGCFASGCDQCISNAAACAPQQVPATFADVAFTFLLGIGITMLTVSLMWLLVTVQYSRRQA